MSKCSCSNNKIYPNETCILCCKKHIAAALALSNEFRILDINLLRAASQLKLASWHFNDNLPNYADLCNDIIIKIINFQHFKDDLLKINSMFLNDALTLDANSFEYKNTNINLLEGVKPDFKLGMLCISNSIELYYYEDSYKDINKQYVLGQLIMASWHFQKHYKNYSLKTRLIYNKLDAESFKIDELIEFRDLLWKKYKDENCISNLYIQNLNNDNK